MDKIVLKADSKGAQVLRHLQANEGEFFGDELAVALDLNQKGIHGVMNGLVKKELVGKTAEKVSRKVLDKEGKEVEREYVKYFITSAGQAFEIPAE